jgi:hypothetical protein
LFDSEKVEDREILQIYPEVLTKYSLEWSGSVFKNYNGLWLISSKEEKPWLDLNSSSRLNCFVEIQNAF